MNLHLNKISIVFLSTILLFGSCSESKKAFGEKGDNARDVNFRTVADQEFTRFEDFQHSNFDENSAVIDNEWMPMTPGIELVYEGYDINEEGEEVDHSIYFTVTDLTKEIDGIQAVVLYERDYSDGELEEAELAFFAQDKEGNVWHLGQYYEIYEGAEFVGGRMWVVGHLEDAKAGVFMLADPLSNSKSYSQGYAPPPFLWTDRARVVETGQIVTTSMGEFEDIVVIEEYNQLEPNAFQLKYFAKGIGNIGVGWKGDDENKETMDLVEIKELNPEEMKKKREEALELEKRAYIYGTTKPSVIRS